VANRHDLTALIAPVIKNAVPWPIGSMCCAPLTFRLGRFYQWIRLLTIHRLWPEGQKIHMTHSATSTPIALVASPLKMSETPVDYRYAPPTVGADTDRVLQEILNINQDEIQKLKNSGVIG
jgi:crotonobetainyl-CoA:carnitine CoA-transferase CaiB-like acyl-CoA transferase